MSERSTESSLAPSRDDEPIVGYFPLTRPVFDQLGRFRGYVPHHREPLVDDGVRRTGWRNETRDERRDRCIFEQNHVSAGQWLDLRGRAVRLRRVLGGGLNRRDPILRRFLDWCAHVDIDDLVDEWHDGDGTGPLHDHLGLTRDEYAMLVEDPSSLRFRLIMAARK